LADVCQLAVKGEHGVTIDRPLPVFAFEGNLMRYARANELVSCLTVSNCSLNPSTTKAGGTSIWRRLNTVMMSEPPRRGWGRRQGVPGASGRAAR
jgi:hypothetical protein